LLLGKLHNPAQDRLKRLQRKFLTDDIKKSKLSSKCESTRKDEGKSKLENISHKSNNNIPKDIIEITRVNNKKNLDTQIIKEHGEKEEAEVKVKRMKTSTEKSPLKILDKKQVSNLGSKSSGAVKPLRNKISNKKSSRNYNSPLKFKENNTNSKISNTPSFNKLTIEVNSPQSKEKPGGKIIILIYFHSFSKRNCFLFLVNERLALLRKSLEPEQTNDIQIESTEESFEDIGKI